MQPLRAYAFLAAGMGIFGTATPAARAVTDALPVWVAAFLRMASGALFLVPYLAWRARDEKPVRPRKDEHARLFALSFVGVVLFTAFLLYGTKLVSGSVGGVVMATTPAVTALGGVLFRHESMTRWRVLGVALAVTGVVALRVAGGGDTASEAFWLGAALVFGAVVSEATYTLLAKSLMDRIGHVALATYATLGALAILVPLAAWDLARDGWTTPDAGTWAWLVWWGAGVMGLGSLLWFRGVQQVPATVASAFMGVMPLSAIATSYIALGEPFHVAHALGAALVVAGILAMAYGERDEGDTDEAATLDKQGTGKRRA